MIDATFRQRLFAFLLDYLLIAAYAIFLLVMTLVLLRAARLPPIDNPFLLDLIAFVTLILPVIFYFAFSEAGTSQATWGKRKLGLKVVRTDNGRLHLSQAFGRAALKFLPWQLGHTAVIQTTAAPENIPPILTMLYVLAYGLALLYVLVLWRSGHAPYDRLVGARVVVH